MLIDKFTRHCPIREIDYLHSLRPVDGSPNAAIRLSGLRSVGLISSRELSNTPAHEHRCRHLDSFSWLFVWDRELRFLF
jgi:hypothetical protein